jgi:hypothetical protein
MSSDHNGTTYETQEPQKTNTTMSIHFGSTEIVELADNIHDFNESKRTVTMSVDDFERRRFMRLQRQDSEIETLFFLDRMASSTLPPSRPLMAPQRKMSRDNIFEREEETSQPLKMPERKISLTPKRARYRIFQKFCGDTLVLKKEKKLPSPKSFESLQSQYQSQITATRRRSAGLSSSSSAR